MGVIKRNKKVVLADTNDQLLFSQKYEKYHVFDKNIVIQQSINEVSSDISTISNYIKNGIIKRELERAIKDKTYSCLIYLLQGSDQNDVRTRIEDMCNNSTIKNTIVVDFDFIK